MTSNLLIRMKIVVNRCGCGSMSNFCSKHVLTRWRVRLNRNLLIDHKIVDQGVISSLYGNPESDTTGWSFSSINLHLNHLSNRFGSDGYFLQMGHGFPSVLRHASHASIRRVRLKARRGHLLEKSSQLCSSESPRR